MVGEKVLDYIITCFQSHATRDFTAFGRVSVLLSIEKWEKVHLPGHVAPLLNVVVHFLELDSVVDLCAVNFKFVFCLESFAALGTRHFKSCLKFYVFVLVDFHLACMVCAVFLLTDFVFNGFAMFFEKFFTHKTLCAGSALIAASAFNLVI